MIFVTFTIDYGGYEYLDYSWFKNYSLAHYENGESITDKDIIRDVYGEGRGDEDFENHFNEETKVYTDYNDDTIAVHRVQEMTQKELDVLVKMGVVAR
jgi:protein-disulfide isomerase-like protein with CxxC motif